MSHTVNRRKRLGYMYMIPSLVILAVFVIYPVIYGAVTSLYDWDWVAGIDKKLFVGLGNYLQIFSDRLFWNALKNTVIFAVLSLLAEFVLGLCCAMLLYKIKKDEAIEFVHGIGKRKTMLQRSIEKLEEYTEKLKEYTNKLYKCGRRNSYSKTDNDATFMRMKEDAMLNGQLKPAYNLQHGVDAEYVTWLGIYPNPTDTLTLIPFLKDMEEHLPFKYKNIVADAGYESEENYVFIENNDQTGYIKPQNYELSKTRKFKKDISKRENMDYDSETDSYTCKNGKKALSCIQKKTKDKDSDRLPT